MADTNIQSGKTRRMPTGQEVYDMLMAKIEPDLVTTSIPTLKEKYAGETEDMRSVRMKRYEEAFELYRDAFTAWAAKLNELVVKHRHASLEKKENTSAAKDAAIMKDLESQMNNLAA